MIVTIVLTSIINWLISAVLFFMYQLRHSETQIRRLRKENGHMSGWILSREQAEQEERVRRSYDHGLYDGMQTDMLYCQTPQNHQGHGRPPVIVSEYNNAANQSYNGRVWDEN